MKKQSSQQVLVSGMKRTSLTNIDAAKLKQKQAIQKRKVDGGGGGSPSLGGRSQLEQRDRRKTYSKSFVNQEMGIDSKPRGLGKSQSMKKIGSTGKNKKNLPTGFAQSVINQEFQIEKGGVELIELIALYQSAVEYYDSIGDTNNSDIYKQKITFVFMKPHISKLFMTPKGKDKSRSPKHKLSPKRSSPPEKKVSPARKAVVTTTRVLNVSSPSPTAVSASNE